MVDFRLVDAKGTVHPFASEKISFELSFKPDSQLSTPNSQLTTPNSPVFMGGWNSGVFGEASPIGKDFVNLECGMARVFVKAGRSPGKAILKWKIIDGVAATPGRARSPVSPERSEPRKRSLEVCAPSGEIVLELKPFAVNNGISAMPHSRFTKSLPIGDASPNTPEFHPPMKTGVFEVESLKFEVAVWASR